MSKKVHRIEIEITGGAAPPDVLRQLHESVKLINRFYSPVPQLTYDDVIERGLLLVRTEPTYLEMAEAFVYVVANELDAGDLKNWGLDLFAQDTERMRDWWAKSESYRQEFRRRLDELVSDPEQARGKHLDADTAVLRESLLGVLDFDNQGNFFPRFFPMTIVAAFTYVLHLLYNEKHNRWRRLTTCECCDSYFLRKGGGGRPRKYCSTECYDKADQKMALVRQKRQRQRKSK